MAMQVNSYNSSMTLYRSRQASVKTDAEAAPSANNAAPLKNLNLTQPQLNQMVSGGRIAGSAGIAGLLLGFIFPPLHFLVAVGFIATLAGFGASVIGDALGGKG
ncbi:MAG TPA: hypothetical protein DD435_12010 [Cyanobacteria bacterium UBA8530]|nr:hypothetical protein [Cyanobacteria bacterium UBA8530]